MEFRLSRIVLAATLGLALPLAAQTPSSPPRSAEKIIIDTDIDGDIDDAFAVALALRSPELETLGISTAFGDTKTRALGSGLGVVRIRDASRS